MSDTEVKEKSMQASRIFLQSEIYKNAKQIMLYLPLDNEMDTNFIMECAFNDKKNVVLPVTDAKSGIITPCLVTKKTQFAKGAFSVYEPLDKKVADMSKTDVIVVPGIAFNKRGERIGFGKGCYDRLLRDTKTIRVGFCYDFQICEEFKGEEHDVAMNFLISNSGMIKIL